MTDQQPYTIALWDATTQNHLEDIDRLTLPSPGEILTLTDGRWVVEGICADSDFADKLHWIADICCVEDRGGAA